jgi:pumilio RNA-binding family
MRSVISVVIDPSLLTPPYRGRVVELATNCYGCHVLQKALDCEEDIRLLIVSELLLGDPAQTLVNKHASHVWSKVRTKQFPLTTGTNHKIDNGIVLDISRPSDFCVVRVSWNKSYFYSRNGQFSVNKSLQGKWASLACHETGSLVVQVRLYIWACSDTYVIH